MNAVIYARYSEGPRQTDQSIEGQVADCTSYAQANNIKIVGIYADRHISGKSMEGRDEFQKMLRDAERHLFDAVIVWKIDRFGRNREDIALSKVRLKRAGVRLLYAKEAIPEGPEGILLESLLEGLAEYYSEDLRQKIVRGLREGAKKGKAAGGLPPLGYVRDPEGRVVVDPEQAEIVRELFRLHNAGAKLDELVAFLSRKGVRGRRGAEPNRALVYRILRNEKYTGQWEIMGIQIPVEPIISREVYMQAAENFRTSRNAAGKAKIPYLLSGKCICGRCGTKMTGKSGTSKNGRKYRYYACHTKGCNTAPVAAEKLEDEVVKLTCQDMLTVEMIEKLTDAIMGIQEQQRQMDPGEDIEKRLDSAIARRDNILRALEMSSSQSLAARLDILEQEVEDLTLELEKARVARPVVPREVVIGWLESFRSGDKDDPAVRKRLLSSFVAMVEIGDEFVEVYYNTSLKNDDAERPEACSHTVTEMEMTKRYANTPRVVGPWIVVSIPR
jgi:DNA invertase Pin-like site-specific DNA recombinase